jgi:hypothetical protein
MQGKFKRSPPSARRQTTARRTIRTNCSQQELTTRVVADRQSQLRLDTEKLVALTAELKQHVDKAGANVLSMDVIKKAQQIQKLAKSVQDKMRNAY